MNEELENKNLEKAIIRTIVFFDMFDYPLTAFEVWKYLGVKCELGEVVEILNQLHPNPLLKKEGGRIDPPQLLSLLRQGFGGQAGGELNIEMKNSFYFLKGREEIIETRLRRYNYTDEKFKRALWVSQIFKLIPWIKGIAIGNIIGAHNLKKEGDIDFFIITQKNRIWISRFYCILITKILRLRPSQGNTKDKICLSFFVSEERLDLKNLMLDDKETKLPIGSLVSINVFEKQDIYFTHWLAGLVPIYNYENIFENFFQKNNWLKEYLPNWQSSRAHFKRKVQEKSFCKIFSFWGAVGDGVFKFLQIKMMNEKLKELMNKDTRVVVDDQILKLHVNDRREEYGEKYYNKLNEIFKQNN